MKINKRKLQYASLSTAFIVLFVVLVMLFNVFVGYLTNRFSLKLDLTASSEYALSDDTKELLHGLNEDVTVYIMQSEAAIQKDASDTKPRIVETIRRYNSESGNKVKYEFIDPNQNPKFYDDYPLAKATKEGETSAFLIVKSERRYTPILFNSLVATDENRTSYYYSTESELSSAILFVTSEEVSKVAKITGHNETELSGFQTIIDGNKFESVSVNLRTEDIPEGVNNLLIAAPNIDYSAEEIAKIDAFLTTPGNNVYVFWNGDLAQKLPVLERFLSDWGMAIGESVILDQERAFSSPVMPVGELQENDVTQKIQATQQLYLSPQTHPITILWEEKSYTRTLPLVVSSSSSYGRVLSANANISDARKDNEPKGPFCMAAVGEKNVQKSDGGIESNRVFLFGSNYMADESITGISISINNTLLNTVVSYANSNTKTMSIAPKVTQQNDLNFYESQINMLLIILVIVMPLAILAFGLVIFFRRRHR